MLIKRVVYNINLCLNNFSMNGPKNSLNIFNVEQKTSHCIMESVQWTGTDTMSCCKLSVDINKK